MRNSIKLRMDEESGETYLDLKEILEGTTTRVSTVKFYKLEELENNVLVLRLYNKNKKLIKLRSKNG